MDGGDPYRKLSARPRAGAREWYAIEYDDSVSDADVRALYWRAFLTDPAPCPSRPQETKTSTEHAAAQTTEPPPVSPPEKEPPVSTEPAPEPPLKEEKPPKSGHSHSTNHAGTDYENDWWETRDWEYRNDWWNGNRGGWSESRHWTNKEWANEPLDTPRIPPPTVVIAQPPAERESVDSPVSAIQSPIGNQGHPSQNAPFRVGKVTVQTKTLSLEVTRSTDGVMLKLQKLETKCQPLTHEDRLVRKTMANQMPLPPELYNLLVFGESDGVAPEGTALFALGSGTATCDLPPAESSPPIRGHCVASKEYFAIAGWNIAQKWD